jgi:hypothetical protein
MKNLLTALNIRLQSLVTSSRQPGHDSEVRHTANCEKHSEEHHYRGGPEDFGHIDLMKMHARRWRGKFSDPFPNGGSISGRVQYRTDVPTYLTDTPVAQAHRRL